jgi:phosphate starvation-inducible PhoH-like protein
MPDHVNGVASRNAEGEWTPWQHLRDTNLDEILAQKRQRQRLKPITPNQSIYFDAMRQSTVTICTGPAGTGKTYMSCGLAADMLRDGLVKKIVLTRPLVTCSGRHGQGVGFLKGTLLDKVCPFMRPLLDALHDFLSPAEVRKYIEDEVVEPMTLDMMRGTSLRNAFVIADEMQNAEEEQWLMLLTRLGEGTKLVASGDLTQTDLRSGRDNGLLVAIDRLEGDPDISVVRLTEADIVRSGIVRRILARWNAGK